MFSARLSLVGWLLRRGSGITYTTLGRVEGCVGIGNVPWPGRDLLPNALFPSGERGIVEDKGHRHIKMAIVCGSHTRNAPNLVARGGIS